jgi:hypothetical protein
LGPDIVSHSKDLIPKLMTSYVRWRKENELTKIGAVSRRNTAVVSNNRVALFEWVFLVENSGGNPPG